MEQVALYEQYGTELSPKVIFLFIDYLQAKGLKYIVAPYEADSQLAFM